MIPDRRHGFAPIDIDAVGSQEEQLEVKRKKKRRLAQPAKVMEKK